MENKDLSIAIAGASGLIGSHLLTALVNNRNIKRIVVIDEIRPRLRDANIRFAKTDLREGSSVELIGRELKKNRCTALIHAALPFEPAPKSEDIHEFQTAGTMHLLLAAETASLRKLILLSTAEVYGALPDNPSFLTEEHPLRGGQNSDFLADKIDAEKQFARYQKRFPGSIVTILRPCTVIGPDAAGSHIGLFSQPAIPTVMGFDPLMQFIHIDDLIRALITAVERDFRGVYNLAGEGILPLSRALSIAGRINIPISSLLLYPAAHILWHLNIGSLPARHIDFLKYNFIVNSSKARKKMKFKPAYSSQEALLSIKK